jgi:hypothetical protein
MMYRFPLVMFCILFALSVNALSQTTVSYPTKTTAEVTQIQIPEFDGLVKVLVSTADEGRGKRKADYSAEGKIFSADVSLNLGDNEFTIEYFDKDGKHLHEATYVTIKRVTIGGTPKNPEGKRSDEKISSQASAVPKPSVPRPVSQTIAINYAPSATQAVYPKDLAVTPPKQEDIPKVAVDKNTTGSSAENEAEQLKMRLLFGFEQVGASSTNSRGQPFVDLTMDLAIGEQRFMRNGVPKKFTTSFWTNVRLTSTPGQALPDFGAITAATGAAFFASNQSSKVNEIVQSFQTRFGIEESIGKGFGLIAGVGATSPLSAEKTISAFKIPHVAPGGDAPDSFKSIFGPSQNFTNLNTLVLSSGDRDRFQRNWFYGIRLRRSFSPYNNEKDKEKNVDVYPAVFELTFGQDELLTNKLIGHVLKFDSFVPIPVKALSFLYFGASYTAKLTRKVHTTTLPFFLEPISSPNLFANDVYVRNVRDIPSLNSDRDSFSFRFGIDLLQLLNRGDKNKAESPPAGGQTRRPPL